MSVSVPVLFAAATVFNVVTVFPSVGTHMSPRALLVTRAPLVPRAPCVCCSEAVAPREDLQRSISSTPCIVYVTTTCPFCMQAREALDSIGATYTTVELDNQPGVRTELARFTSGRTSVPAVFVGGEFVGGANDGGLGGVLTLQREERLIPLLRAAGALDADAGTMNDLVATVFSKVLFKGGSGKKIAWGVLQQDVDLSAVPSAEEREARRAAAAHDLTNIDTEERERRRLAGTAFSGMTAALALGLLASHAAPLARFAIAPPLFLSYGFLASAREGL